MPVSLHTATVGHYLQILPAMIALVDKAEAHCRDSGADVADLTGCRLAEDMWPFAKQVAMIAHQSAGAIEGVRKGEFGPDLSAPPEGFAALRQCLVDALASAEAVTEAELEGMIGRDMCFKFGDFRRDFTVEDFLLTFSLPNFYFHATTAYALLRSQGVQVGKMDFMGSMRLKG